MQTWTAVNPSTLSLPADLALLVAPVRGADPTGQAEQDVGRAEGVILNETGGIVGFFLRLSSKVVPGSPLTLVPASAMTVAHDASLLLTWPHDKLTAQPRLDEKLHPEVAGIPGPGEGKVHVDETVKEGIEGSAVGAAVGAIIGGLAGGPILGFALAAFFATGGGLVGFISGGGQETHDAPKGLITDPAKTEAGTALRRLEERLRDSSLATGGQVHVTQFSPTAAEAGTLTNQAPNVVRAS